MDDVLCSGTESQLMDCTFTLNHNCAHYEDAGVLCTSSTSGKKNKTKKTRLISYNSYL